MKLLLHVSNQISCRTEALSFQHFSMQFLHIGTGHTSEQLPQNIRGLDSDQAPKGGCNSSGLELKGVPGASSRDWSKGKFCPHLQEMSAWLRIPVAT